MDKLRVVAAVFAAVLLALAACGPNQAPRSERVGTRVAEPKIAPDTLAQARVAAFKAALEAKGYLVTDRSAPTPMMIDGEPALAVIVADQHTAEGARNTEAALRDIKALAIDATPISAVLLEGHSSQPGTDAEAKRLIGEFAAKVDETVSVLSAAEFEAAGLGRAEPNGARYETPRYDRLGIFPTVVGIESADPQELFRMSVRLDFHVGTDSIRSDFASAGRCLLLVDNKFVSKGAGKFLMAFEELRSRHYREDLAVPFTRGLLVEERYRAPDGVEHTAQYLEPRSFAPFSAQQQEFVRKWDLFGRSKALAQTTAEIFRRPGAAARVAVVLGGDHLKWFDDTVEHRSYTQWLQEHGVSSISVFPKARKGTAKVIESK